MRLLQHKNIIFRGSSLEVSKREIEKEIGYLEQIGKIESAWFNSKELVVDSWQEVLEHFLYYPQGSYKVIVFDNADELSINFQNKLLKQIEESSNRIITVFNTTKPLLTTIESRAIKITVQSDKMLSLPKTNDALYALFDVEEAKGNEAVLKQIRGLFEAILHSKSLIQESGLLKEKSAALSCLSTHINKIAQLILLKDIADGVYSHRARVAKQYLECEPSENNLYNMLLKIEAIES